MEIALEMKQKKRDIVENPKNYAFNEKSKHLWNRTSSKKKNLDFFS